MQEPGSKYPKCQVHSSEYLQLVCLTCDHDCLACPLCVDNQHQMHQMISLKKFIQNQVPKIFAKKEGQKESPNRQKIHYFIQLLNSSYKSSIEHMRKQIGHEINELQLFFQEKGDRLLSELDFICGSYSIHQLRQNIEATKTKISKGLHLPGSHELQSKIKDLTHKMQQFIHDSTIQIRRIIFSIKEIFHLSTNFLLNSSSAPQYQFSSKHKHHSLDLVKNCALINKLYDNSYHTCAILPALTPYHSEIKLRVKKSENKCVWVGISDLRSLEESEYTNTYKKEGANYWLWQAGGDQSAEYYSGLNLEQEKPLIGWNFQIGDIISIEVINEESGTKKVKFSKNKDKNKQECQEYSEKIDQKVGFYYPCVSLGEQGQSIEIINTKF